MKHFNFVFLLIFLLLSCEKQTNKELIKSQDSTTIKTEEKKEIKLIDTLTNEEKQLRLNKLRKNYDEFKGITWFYDKTTTKYNNRNSFHAYIATGKDFATSLRLRIQYFGDDWLFIESYIIKTDFSTFTLTPDKVESDHSSEVWEWCDVSVDSEIYKILKDITNSKVVKVRMIGKYYKDREIPTSEKKALLNVIKGFEALGGVIK
ncbi:MAG: hypothetical protein V1779_12255 [bacterium]